MPAPMTEQRVSKALNPLVIHLRMNIKNKEKTEGKNIYRKH